MYIPTIFLAGLESCANLQISASNLPTSSFDGDGDINFGQIGSGSENPYFFVRCDVGEQVYFDIADGLTTQAKILLIGGGGGVDISYNGGGAAGDVIFQDITLQPGKYLLSSSANPGDGTTQAGNSYFITNADEIDPLKQTWYVAYGGDNNQTNGYGGNNTNYGGGAGSSTPGNAGGGGAGSGGNGFNAVTTTGGNGGAGTTVGAPFNTINDISSTFAGGGGGAGATGYVDGNPVAFNKLGSGATYDRNPSPPGADIAGRPGAAFLFLPIRTCELVPTGSILLDTDEPFEAIGGTYEGTFVSGSTTYKYHLFTNDSPNLNIFAVKRGFTTEAKALLVGGGAGARYNLGAGGYYAGGAGAGGVSIKRNMTLYGAYQIEVGSGGAQNQNGAGSYITALSTFVTYVGAHGGGKGGAIGEAGTDGGSGGGGWATANQGEALPSSALGKWGNVDEIYGNDGGQGATIGTAPAVYYGGGGGGAGSAGETGGPSSGAGGSGYILDDEFFPSSVLFASASIARGGNAGHYGITPATQPYSGDGGQPTAPGTGSDGFVCITYPIS